MPAIVQRSIAVVALVLLAIPMLVLALLVRMTSTGPVLHRARRVGRGRTFTLYKFRSMVVGSADRGPAVTVAGDRRITRVGRLLRRTRLDELPQLLNVVRGEMLLVGPRPEDPDFVDWGDPLHRRVFGARPGITGATALAFRDEGSLLEAEATHFAREQGRESPKPGDVDRAYRERILPAKLAMDAAYLDGRSARGDLAILVQTVLAAIGRGPAPLDPDGYAVAAARRTP